MQPSPDAGRRPPRIALLALALQALLVREAHAYLDPGSVSLFFQALIAAFLGGILVLKRYWQQIKAGVRSLFSSRSDDEPG